MKDDNFGCLIFVVAILALIFNPSIDSGKKKVEGDSRYRALIQNSTEVRLYRDGYFVFSEYYIGVGSNTPSLYGVGAFGFIIEKNDKGLNKSGKFDESVKLE